jgi:cobyrinic acid a,c-diamide synthase
LSAHGHGIPRVVIAGTASGVGKTTVTIGLARALRARGLRIAVFKCGPDYLDPTYHARGAGVPSHNVDGWMMGRDAVLATVARASADADVALVEGVMGLFDGASPTGEEGSTAEIAKWLRAPVLLGVDAAGMARSVSAVASGFARFDPDLAVDGLVCNRVGSRGHLELLRRAVGRPPIVGGLPEEPALAFPERHLGLLTADEEAVPEDTFAGWGERVAEWFDLDRILRIARGAPALPEAETIEGLEVAAAPPCRIGIAFDEAFHFYYADNLRRLEHLGATLVRFSPIHDLRPPDVDGLYLGGGYPEVHAEALARNATMREAIAAVAARGAPVYAECGGLMYLAAGIRTLDGRLHPMVGLLPGEAVMAPRLQALGYVEVETQDSSILGPAGLRFRGHQFRYSDLRLVCEDVERVYTVRRRGGEVVREGYRTANTVASYVHAHWASNPLVAEGFVDACVTHAGATR